MIELEMNDLLKIKEKGTENIYFSIVDEINNTDDSKPYRYATSSGFAFGDDFMDNEYLFKIIAVWRYDENIDDYLKIYDEEKPYNEVEPDSDKEKPFDPLERGSGMEAPSHDLKTIGIKPADVEYEKYIQVKHENDELKVIIIELNKKLYGKNN